MSEHKKGPDIIRHTIDGNGKPFVRDTDIRGNQLNNNDISKAYTVGLNDIDSGIMYHIKNVLLPTVVLNGLDVPVPVQYANPEIAATINSGGVVRDSAGKFVFPIIVVQRENIETDKGRPTKMDSNYTQNYYTYSESYTRENRFDKFDLLNNRVPVKKIYRIAIPDFIIANYVIYIYTDFVEHNNKIVEVMKYASNSYWGEGIRSYRVTIDSIPTSTDFSDENGGRVVLSQFNVRAYGYILPDAVITRMSSDMKQFSKSVVNISIDENY
jgi:hypothetical protein